MGLNSGTKEGNDSIRWNLRVEPSPRWTQRRELSAEDSYPQALKLNGICPARFQANANRVWNNLRFTTIFVFIEDGITFEHTYMCIIYFRETKSPKYRQTNK